MSESNGRKSHFVWAVKLVAAIKYQKTVNEITTVYTAVIDQITETDEAPKRIIDSINQHNQGVVPQPQRYSFTLRVRENSRAMLALLWLLLNNRPFDVVLMPDPAVNEENAQLEDTWYPVNELYSKCFAIRRTNTIVIDDVPVSTFNCIALERKASSITGTPFGDGSWQEDGENGTQAIVNGDAVMP